MAAHGCSRERLCIELSSRRTREPACCDFSDGAGAPNAAELPAGWEAQLARDRPAGSRRLTTGAVCATLNPDRRIDIPCRVFRMTQAPILDHVAALSEPTRCRMLLLLEHHELTVSELCAVLQMPQSSVSRHLKTLADDRWVTSRRDATSRFYTMPVEDLDPGARRLWPIIREQVASTPTAGQDQRRLRSVLARRRARSQEFFANAAGQWDKIREAYFGDTFYLWGVLGLIDPTLVVGDLGCGTGQLTDTIAPYVQRVIAVDASADMLDAARRR